MYFRGLWLCTATSLCLKHLFDMKFTNEQMKKIVLCDDATERGGTSHSMETLYEFCEEAGLLNVEHTEINAALVECGILPVAPCGMNPHEIIRRAEQRGLLGHFAADAYDVVTFVFDAYSNITSEKLVELDIILDEYEECFVRRSSKPVAKIVVLETKCRVVVNETGDVDIDDKRAVEAAVNKIRTCPSNYISVGNKVFVCDDDDNRYDPRTDSVDL